MQVAAGIATYNPEIQLLEQNIKSIVSQTDIVLICDNNSDNIKDIEKVAKNYDTTVIKLNENKGIAFALNTMVKWCLDNKYEWLLTLDQDSITIEGLVERYKKNVDVAKVAMMSCDLASKDKIENGGFKQNQDDKFEYIEKCYTSGSFINTELIAKVGFFDERMFIDFVDFDMCITLLERGYKIIRLNYLGLIHEVGTTKEVSFLGSKELIYNHAPIRKYYMARNGIYYAKKHKKYFGKKETIKRKLSVLKRILLVLIYEKQKLIKLAYGIKGLAAGIFIKVKGSNIEEIL